MCENKGEEECTKEGISSSRMNILFNGNGNFSSRLIPIS